MAKQEYIERNIQWLAAKAQEVGVLPIDKGIYYKVIRPGIIGKTKSAILKNEKYIFWCFPAISGASV